MIDTGGEYKFHDTEIIFPVLLDKLFDETNIFKINYFVNAFLTIYKCSIIGCF